MTDKRQKEMKKDVLEQLKEIEIRNFVCAHDSPIHFLVREFQRRLAFLGFCQNITINIDSGFIFDCFQWKFLSRYWPAQDVTKKIIQEAFSFSYKLHENVISVKEKQELIRIFIKERLFLYKKECLIERNEISNAHNLGKSNPSFNPTQQDNTKRNIIICVLTAATAAIAAYLISKNKNSNSSDEFSLPDREPPQSDNNILKLPRGRMKEYRGNTITPNSIESKDNIFYRIKEKETKNTLYNGVSTRGGVRPYEHYNDNRTSVKYDPTLHFIQ